MQPNENTPVGTRVRLIDNYGMMAKVGATATVVEPPTYRRKHSSFLDIRWDRNDLAGPQADGGYFFSVFEIINDSPQVGDHVTVHGVVNSTKDNTVTVRTSNGRTFCVHRDHVTVTKRVPQPLTEGQAITYGGKAYSVTSILNNGHAVILRDGTIADYKIVHNNDVKIGR